jgi:hypothetical protein
MTAAALHAHEALILVVAGVIAFVAFLVLLIVMTTRRYRANLEHAAGRVGGRVVSSFWKGDGLEWEADGIPAQLRYFIGTDKAPPWTRIRFQWSPAGRLRVVPEGFFAKLRKCFGAQDLQIGDGSFDARYLIQGSPSSWVREALTPDVRRSLDTLSELGASFWRGKGIRLDATPAGLTLFCYRNLVPSPDQLALFINEGLAILRGLRTAGSSGSGVLSAEAAETEGRCPVCGQLLEDALHRCEACATRHHADCWTYFGGCAIYACRLGGGARLPAKKA